MEYYSSATAIVNIGWATVYEARSSGTEWVYFLKARVQAQFKEGEEYV